MTMKYEEMMEKKREACKKLLKEILELKEMKNKYLDEKNNLVEAGFPVPENIRQILIESLNKFMSDENTSLPIEGIDLDQESAKRRDEGSTTFFSFWYDPNRDKVLIVDPSRYIDRDVLIDDVSVAMYRMSLVLEKNNLLSNENTITK